MTILKKLGDSINQCFYCERPFNVEHYGTNKACARTRDHIIALGKGGTNHARNMVHCCSECNGLKQDLLLQSFIDKINNQYVGAGKKYKTIPIDTLCLIAKKAELLIAYVEKEGERLYRKEGHKAKRVKKPSLVGDYLKRVSGEPRNTSYPTIAAINKEAKKYLKSLGDDSHLSVNTNTSRQSQDHIHFLSSQTIEQFDLAKKHGWEIAKQLTAPEPDFHHP